MIRSPTPGEADLTAHVDFEALAHAFLRRGAASTALTPQGVFLERLGIAHRAGALARDLERQLLSTLICAAHRRLTDPDKMGQLFKSLACYPAGMPTPPGLDPMR